MTGAYIFVVPSQLTDKQCEQILATSSLARQRELAADHARGRARLEALLYLSDQRRPELLFVGEARGRTQR